jgi:hypothetical protein
MPTTRIAKGSNAPLNCFDTSMPTAVMPVTAVSTP